MPTLTFGVSAEAPRVPVQSPKPRVVFTPRPQLPEAPPSWKARPVQPRVGVRFAFHGSPLPSFVLTVGVEDVDSELAMMLLTAIQAYD